MKFVRRPAGISAIRYNKCLITMSLTSIPLSKETREKLRRYGKKGETWDQLINRILDEVLPRQPASIEELERRRKNDEYIPLGEALKGLDKL